MFYVYFLSNSKDSSIYVGYTKNVDQRVVQHNQGKTRSLKSKIPVKVVKIEQYKTKTEVRKRELYLKRSWDAKIHALRTIDGPIV